MNDYKKTGADMLGRVTS